MKSREAGGKDGCHQYRSAQSNAHPCFPHGGGSRGGIWLEGSTYVEKKRLVKGGTVAKLGYYSTVSKISYLQPLTV